MKRKITFSALLAFVAGSFAIAQPVLNDSSTVIPVGMGDSVSVITSATSPGTGGANHTWDFSALTPVTGGYAQFVTPASTPYAASYPAATRAVKIDIPSLGTIYEYDIVSNTKWEMLAGNVTASSGDNYTANPKTMVPFSFHFSDVVVDTFYKNATGPYTVEMTYDGYGTLVTPFGTYNNVIRMKRSFGGNDYYYDWYSTSPYLSIVVSYDNNTQKFTFTGSSTTGVNKVTAAKANVIIYPNPFSETTKIAVNTTEDLTKAIFTLADLTGRVVKEMPANTHELLLSREGLNPGIYFYSINTNGLCLAKGKISIQ